MTELQTTEENNVISVKGLKRSFNDHPVLRGIDINFLKGESVGILGANGAGKTTLLRILATILSPSSGDIFIKGINLKDKNPDVRRYIGMVSHQPFLYLDLTAYENLLFYARMYDVEDKDSRIKEVIESVGLAVRMHERVNTYSRGMLQRLSIARAILHKPEILLLDEPDTGLDRQAMSSLWSIVKGESDTERTVIFTTHDIGRGVALSDRVLIVNKGRIVYDNPSKDLNADLLHETYLQATGTSA